MARNFRGLAIFCVLLTWDQALFSFRFENYIPAGKAKRPLERMYENRSNWAWSLVGVLRELNFAIMGDWFFLLGINFCNFQRSIQYPALMIFSFLLSACNRNTYFQTINQYFVVHRFVSEWRRQVVIEQTRFLSTVFLCSEFKLENIYSGVNFCGKNVCGNFYLWELIFADRWKIAKLEPEKISYGNRTRPGDSTVPTAIYQHCFHPHFLTVNFPELQPMSTVTARQSSLWMSSPWRNSLPVPWPK